MNNLRISFCEIVKNTEKNASLRKLIIINNDDENYAS